MINRKNLTINTEEKGDGKGSTTIHPETAKSNRHSDRLVMALQNSRRGTPKSSTSYNAKF